MLFSLVAMSCLLAAQATPLGHGIELGQSNSRGILEDVVGSGLGMTRRGIGGIEQSVSSGVNRGIGDIERLGEEYRRRDSEESSNGYGNSGYEREGGSSSHDRGHLQRDYKQITESHVSEGHNSGQAEGYGSRGHESSGHSRYGAEQGVYGSRINSGLEV